MRRRRIDHGRKVGAGLAAVDEDFTSASRWTHTGGETRDGFHRARPLARQRRAEPIDQQVFCLANHGLRNVVKTQASRKAGKLRSRRYFRSIRHDSILFK